jgi:hypothetical protein
MIICNPHFFGADRTAGAMGAQFGAQPERENGLSRGIKRTGPRLIRARPRMVFTRRHPSTKALGKWKQHGLATGHAAASAPIIGLFGADSKGKAAGEGFEPPRGMTLLPIDNRLPSTAQPTRLKPG